MRAHEKASHRPLSMLCGASSAATWARRPAGAGSSDRRTVARTCNTTTIEQAVDSDIRGNPVGFAVMSRPLSFAVVVLLLIATFAVARVDESATPPRLDWHS